MTEQPETDEATFRVSAQQFDGAISVDAITEHPDNPNEGDIGAISESMDAHGFLGAILVQRSTGRVLAGNHRYRTAVLKGASTIPGFWLDVDDDSASRILAVDNRTSQLATFDNAKLLQLLAGAAISPRGLEGTGYDGDDLDHLVKIVQGGYQGEGGGGDDDVDDAADKLAQAGWPVIHVAVPRDIRERWDKLMLDGHDNGTREHERVGLIVTLAERAKDSGLHLDA